MAIYAILLLNVMFASVASADIGFWSNGLKMIGITTSPIPTQVVNLVTLLNFSINFFISKPVGVIFLTPNADFAVARAVI